MNKKTTPPFPPFIFSRYLRESWLVVDPRASVPVGAGAHLEVEGAIHLVLLRAKNTGQILRHFGCCSCLLTTSLQNCEKSYFKYFL